MIVLKPNRGKSKLGRDLLRLLHPEFDDILNDIDKCISPATDSKEEIVTIFRDEKGKVGEVIDYRGNRVIAFGTEKVLFSHEEPQKESWVIFGLIRNNPPPIIGGG